MARKPLVEVKRIRDPKGDGNATTTRVVVREVEAPTRLITIPIKRGGATGSDLDPAKIAGALVRLRPDGCTVEDLAWAEEVMLKQGGALAISRMPIVGHEVTPEGVDPQPPVDENPETPEVAFMSVLGEQLIKEGFGPGTPEHTETIKLADILLSRAGS